MGNFSLRTLPDAVRAWLGPGKLLMPLYHAGQAAQGCETWPEHLRLVSARLKEVTVSTEGDFLAIGERLQDFYLRADEITTLISGLVNRLGGEETAAAMAGLEDLLDALERHLAGARSGAGQHPLQAILERLDRIATPLNGFGQMNKSLKMLGVFTKIESASLGGRAAGFESLAGEVGSLSGQVVRKVEAILLQKNELAAVIRNALLCATSMGSEKQARIQDVLSRTRRSLYTLTTVVERCSSSMSAISSSSAEVTANLGQVVVSLQAHDMVRQQVEHAAAAIDELIERLPASASLPKWVDGNRTTLAVEAGMLCQIQTAQLRNASAELLRAVESIIGNLREIALGETAMASDSGELLGVTDQAGASFFTEMGRDLGEVVTLLAATAAANRELSGVMAGAAGTVGEIFRFVDDIEAIAYDITLIALNFLIQADALGGVGGGLEVLAEAINRLSVEAREQAEEVTGILAEIKDITDGMRRSAQADVAAMEARVEKMRQGVEGMLASLQEMNGETARGLGRANAMVRQLSEDIEEVTGGITVHQRVAAVLAETVAMLDAVARDASLLVPAGEWAVAVDRLRTADSHYTMHSERDIHAAVISGGAAVPPSAGGPPVIGSPPGGSDELGDNVEFF